MSNRNNLLKHNSERGSALIIALLVMILLMGFVALAISRTTTEMIITSNDSSEARTYAATEASLESTTRDFVDIFENKLSPDSTDIDKIKRKKLPGFEKFEFNQTKIEKVKEAAPTVLAGGSYSGLYALRDAWEIDSTATETASKVKVQLKRRFFSDRIPIYQFGMFYEDDLELNRPPLFIFGGRVHTNGNFFVTGTSTSGIYFNSKISAAGEIINDKFKWGNPITDGDSNKVFVNNASGVPQELKTGEASTRCAGVDKAILNAAALAECEKNQNWEDQKAKFQGNLENEVAKLNLPISKIGADPVELIRRGKLDGDTENLNNNIVPVTAASADSAILIKERFANKNGIRISLSDSQKKLPGCTNAAAATNCGVRLDGKFGDSIGYQPPMMADGYKATALNATRLAMSGRETWIKIETVSLGYNDTKPKVADITQDILSLGVTEAAPVGDKLQIDGYKDVTFNGDWTDTRSIIKLQRFAVPGGNISATDGVSYTSNYLLNGKPQNLAVRYSNVTAAPVGGCSGCTAVNSFAAPAPDLDSLSSGSQEDAMHLKWANIKKNKDDSNEFSYAIVPFPIQMFDSREGLPNDNQAEANTKFGSAKIPSSGVMSLVDIDVANMRRFLNGDFNKYFPTNTPFAVTNKRALQSLDIPDANGWVVYFSDRRGDYDFDGAYDMEDIFPDDKLEFNEDLNKNGILDRDYGREAPTYDTAIPRGQAATADHLYYRRGVRLINATKLPGNYNQAIPTNTKGFTFASENGIYVKGNYNVKEGKNGVILSGTNQPAESTNYFPQGGGLVDSNLHIPASIVGDAVTILSNGWNDAESFIHPFSQANRVADDTVIRFAMIAGDGITGDNKATTYSPSAEGQKNGGVHNFKRFLENWNGKRLNYAGSLINLFNSQNNNGFWKCCTTVYTPPTRDWTFDSSFLNINRLPPGTPFIYSVSFTGFQRVND